MRVLSAILAVLILASVASAQGTSPNAQISAAIADARQTLRRDILAASITRGLTVRELINQTGGADELDARLQTVQQIGGARWLDDQTVQVRLSIEGSTVARTLGQIIDKNPKAAPLPPEVIRRGLNQWRNRVFSATGISTGAADITRLQPPPDNAIWSSIPATDRTRALAAARDNAISRVIESLRPIEIQPGRNLDAVLASPDVGGALSTWLTHRPVTSVEFRDDLSIRVVLSAPPQDVWLFLRSALGKQNDANPPTTFTAWDSVQKQVEARVVPAIGVGVVQTPANVSQSDVSLPDLAPPWITQQLEAQGTSGTRGSKLHTARAAEASAIQSLRRQAEALKLKDDLTIGQAARQDPRFEQALAKALDRARPFQVEYGPNGDVTVHVAFSLADLWSVLCDRR